MLQALKQRREDEQGFTLIELMVVVLIIAILLAIAIPTFLGARERAQDRAAQSDIRNSHTAEKVYYTDEEVYTETAADLTAIEPSLTYTTGAGDVDDVGVLLSDAATGAATVADNAVCIGKLSRSGNPFSLLDVAVGDFAGTYYYDNINCGTDTGGALPGGSTTGW